MPVHVVSDEEASDAMAKHPGPRVMGERLATGSSGRYAAATPDRVHAMCREPALARGGGPPALRPSWPRERGAPGEAGYYGMGHAYRPRRCHKVGMAP